MNIYSDERIVLTLDAGGTNFVFSAIQKGKAITREITKPSNAHNLDLCLETIKTGFEEIKAELTEEPVAISFAFPGPADYPNGIIGDLNNLPAFRGGVPLGGILENHFNLPVYINNDGDLYAYGEALGGILPEINAKLEASGSPKRYKNLVGLTLGTGFGAGIVRNKELFIGDNSTAAEVWLFSNQKSPGVNAEDIVSIRAVQRVYAKEAGIDYPNSLSPKDIFEIARGDKEGNREAALYAYRVMGTALGDTIANLLTFIDGIIVIGGGITGAAEFYMPAVFEEINSSYLPSDGNPLPRLVQKIYNLDDQQQSQGFYMDQSKELKIPGSPKLAVYDPVPRLGIATTKIGASKAISLGAYAYALSRI
ncbi:MAG: ROK family protein [Bacteroidales bacterium]|nr:ROK family protein [Bacteroidales bacterium]MCF8406172.1 ROK family protein [Bacteroidales bacterium]